MTDDLDLLIGLLESSGAMTKWERAFVVGCSRHRIAGRELTEKQLKTLAQIRALTEARAAA